MLNSENMCEKMFELEFSIYFTLNLPYGQYQSHHMCNETTNTNQTFAVMMMMMILIIMMEI
jgi:hypothetical protein